MEALVAIISARRPNSVEKMSKFAPNVRWYVAEGETEAYKSAGAVDVVEAGGLIAARNQAIEDAFAKGKASVQLSDDLTKLQRANPDKTASDITLQEVINEMGKFCTGLSVKLAGAAPVPNMFYFDPEKPFKTHHFIVGDLIYIEPSTPRFDSSLKLKEDYDFTAQHIQEYGGVARLDFIHAHFKHRTNAGGAVSYRTPEVEQEAILRLQEKWGDAIRPNSRRENEILFRGEKILRRR